MRNGLTLEQELEVRRLRFEGPLEKTYRIESSEESRTRLRAVFALAYLFNISTTLQMLERLRGTAQFSHLATEPLSAVQLASIPHFWLLILMQLMLPLVPFLATYVKFLLRWVMSLTALSWLVILGYSLATGIGKDTAATDLYRQAMLQALVAMGAVVLIRMPAYLVAFCAYALFAGYLWQGRLHHVMAGETGTALDLSLPSGTVMLFSYLTLLVVGAYLTETIQRRGFLLRRLLAQERVRSEALIANMLPAPIAERLRSNPGVIAEHHAEVTVLFADLVGFTPYSATHSASEVVGRLNTIFSTFDSLVERFGIEKIKTSGDSYMVASGLPSGRPDHLEICLDFALALLERARVMRVDLRAGLNSGPVVAGVIGSKRYMYDLWGDTVNVASRMESAGVPGRLQVTEAIATRMSHQFCFEERGSIEVKGLGKVRTYLLVGRIEGALPNSLSAEKPRRGASD